MDTDLSACDAQPPAVRDGQGIDLILHPLADGGVHEVVLRKQVAVQVAFADVVHDVVACVAAGLTVDDGGVALLMTLKAELVKLLNSCSLVNGVIQTAVCCGAGILRVILCKLCKAFLGLVACIELGKKLLCTVLRDFLGLVGIVAVSIGRCLYQDVST